MTLQIIQIIILSIVTSSIYAMAEGALDISRVILQLCILLFYDVIIWIDKFKWSK